MRNCHTMLASCPSIAWFSCSLCPACSYRSNSVPSSEPLPAALAPGCARAGVVEGAGSSSPPTSPGCCVKLSARALGLAAKGASSCCCRLWARGEGEQGARGRGGGHRACLRQGGLPQGAGAWPPTRPRGCVALTRSRPAGVLLTDWDSVLTWLWRMGARPVPAPGAPAVAPATQAAAPGPSRTGLPPRASGPWRPDTWVGHWTGRDASQPARGVRGGGGVQRRGWLPPMHPGTPLTHAKAGCTHLSRMRRSSLTVAAVRMEVRRAADRFCCSTYAGSADVPSPLLEAVPRARCAPSAAQAQPPATMAGWLMPPAPSWAPRSRWLHGCSVRWGMAASGACIARHASFVSWAGHRPVATQAARAPSIRGTCCTEASMRTARAALRLIRHCTT